MQLVRKKKRCNKNLLKNFDEFNEILCDLQSIRKQKKNSRKNKVIIIECLEATNRRKTIGRGINKKKITITEEEVNYQEIHHRMYLKFIIK